MKISKHLHSCLLGEEQEKTFLIDPGNYTYLEKALDLHEIKKLDYLLITHSHPDHFYLPYVLEIVKKFPAVKIVTTNEIVTILSQENITATHDGDDFISLSSIPHEQLFDAEVPENALITVFGKLTTPGDSHHFTTNAPVLALPIIASWGKTTDAVTLALSLKPKVIIPVHDWLYKDEVRKMQYKRLKEFFETKGIDFKAMETGEQITV